MFVGNAKYGITIPLSNIVASNRVQILKQEPLPEN